VRRIRYPRCRAGERERAFLQKKIEPLIPDGYVSPPKEPVLIGGGVMPAPRCPCETYLDGNVDPACPLHGNLASRNPQPESRP
jgi:hypothetical protein